MVQRFWIVGLVLLALVVGGRADDTAGSKQPAKDQHPGLERLKKLAGTWVAADKDGKPTDQVVSVIKVTSAGSAVQETLFPGQPHEMVSIYYRVGADLVMTHYCALGNQPPAGRTWTRPRTNTCTKGRLPSLTTTTSSGAASPGRAANPPRAMSAT
jgi:hypothetical protein